MSVLIDSSVWIAYFRGSRDLPEMDFLLDENLIVTNDLILAELVPFLHVQKQKRLIRLMYEIEHHSLKIDWPDIIRMQVDCLQIGINGVGIPDLIIAQHAIQNHFQLFSLDRHFALISEKNPLVLYGK